MRKSANQTSTTIETIPELTGSCGRDGATGFLIEKQKRVEQIMPAGDLYFRQVVDAIPALITVMNAAGEVELVNSQVLEYLGKTVEDLKTWATGDAIHPDDLPGVVAAWRRSVETGQAYESEHRQLSGA